MENRNQKRGKKSTKTENKTESKKGLEIKRKEKAENSKQEIRVQSRI